MGGTSSKDDEKEDTLAQDVERVRQTPYAKFKLMGDTCLPPDEREMPRLINREQAVNLLPYLEKENQQEWRMVYNNYSSYGTSIRQFQKHVTHRGPCLMLVRDKGGATFGCYAAESWRVTNAFYGDGRCFLFKISEGGSVERIEYSGKDTNFMYLNLGKDTMPNGIAMGGRFDIGGDNGWFALYVDDDLKFGHSHERTLTFERQPCLASSTEFEVDLLEIIRVSLPSEEEERKIAEMMATKKSALLKNPDARAVMDAMGKENWAARAGVKAEDLGGDSDDELLG